MSEVPVYTIEDISSEKKIPGISSSSTQSSVSGRGRCLSPVFALRLPRLAATLARLDAQFASNCSTARHIIVHPASSFLLLDV